MTHRNFRRLATVVLAPVAALAAWAIARLLGIDLAVSGASGTVGAGHVVAAALAGAVAAWLVVALVERRSRHPRAAWGLIASTGLSLSVIGPSWLADGAAGAVALIALHFVVAVVVIVGFAGTLPAHRGDRPCRVCAAAA
jgi:Family of unknown function (DUF6069)